MLNRRVNDNLCFYRMQVHVFVDNENVYHTIGNLYDLCYRFAVIKHYADGELRYYLVDRATGLIAYKNQYMKNIDNWFKANREAIFKMIVKSQTYKYYMDRWQKMADRRRFQVWENTKP